MFVHTEAVYKISNLTKPIRVIQGGTWAGKTEGIIADYITRLAHHPDNNPEMDLLVVAESIPALKAGAIKIFMNTMRSSLRWHEDHYNYTDRIYHFNKGGRIQFSAFDSVGKAQAAGKRTHLFINEAQYVPYPIVDALMIRTTDDVTFDFNPNNPFYIHEEILGDPDVEHLILTFKDNETTPAKIIKDFDKKISKAFYDSNSDWNDKSNIKNHYWANWCKVYVRGELGSLEGVILQDWSIIDQAPSEGLIGYGMDFGYTNDPTTLIACYVIDGVRVFDELIYQRGLTTPDLARRMNDLTNSYTYTFADSADPKTIAELDQYGIKIQGATKGADSVNRGISILQEEHFKVTARSTNLIKELREYCWDTDREGSAINKPIGIYNHCIDAMRYLAIERLSKSNIPRSQPMITLPKFH